MGNDLRCIALLLGATLASPCHAQTSGEMPVLELYVIQYTSKLDDEQYADWAAYLNDFINRHARQIAFSELSAEKFKQLPCANNAINWQQGAAIFVLANGDSYYSATPIVEPQSYEYVFMKAHEKATPEYLDQFAPDSCATQAY